MARPSLPIASMLTGRSSHSAVFIVRVESKAPQQTAPRPPEEKAAHS